ncbi:hypothetical protein DFJ74DRAFT_673914 [Hyaloraphidium curvatum]|nr:hypothetical protein DFJ74DRAFT_673914 [Hyaloraphidium curvatum]
MPENRLQVMSLYEMDADGALFAKVKSGMLAGIVHCRGAGGAEGVEVNVDLANYINAEPFFRLLPGAASGDPDVDAVLARCRAARERKSWAEGGKTRGKGGKGQDALRAIEVVLLGGVDAADADEENAVVVVTADAAGLEAGESVDKELDGIWVPLRCATALAESLPQPLPEQLADLLSVDDEELGTTTEEEDDKDSDGDIELPQANADLLTAMAAESAAEGPAFDGMLPPASANVLRDIIGGLPSGAVPRSTRQGRARPGSRGASATTTPKRPTGIRTDVSSPQNFPAAFSPVLRELFAEDDASLFSGDDSQSYFNLSSDGEDAAMASGEQSGDHAPLIPGDESDGPGRETRASSGDPIAGEEDERTSKLAEAGLPSIIISALELHHATIPLPPPSAPVWKTSVDGVDVYLTVLPRPRVGSQPSTPSRGEAPFALLGSQIPIVRRVDDGSVNATTLLLAGGLVSDRERSTVLSLEVHKIKIRKKPGLLGTWIPLKRARELSRTYLLESKLAFFLSDGLPRVFAGVDGPVQKSDKGGLAVLYFVLRAADGQFS